MTMSLSLPEFADLVSFANTNILTIGLVTAGIILPLSLIALGMVLRFVKKSFRSRA